MEPWKIKIDEETKSPVFTKPEKDDELPKLVFISPEGKELALDAPGMYEKIIEMGKTEKELRGNTKRLEGQLELFADIEDLSEWKENAEKALKTVADFNDKDWMDVKKVDALKADMKEAHSKQIQQLQESYDLKEKQNAKVLSKKDNQIRTLMVSNKFATHPLFSGKNPKTSLPPEIAETYFGKNFKVEENENGELELRSFYDDGNPVYSHENPGELAGFHEAMFNIFEKYPGKDKLLVSSGGGSGGTGGTGEGEDNGGDELAKLETAYTAAQEKKDIQQMVALKNKIHALRSKKKKAA
jgi:hypothetical protein